jgi:hypothetical protein
VGVKDGLIRLAGLDRPIDVFYLPDEIEISDFEGVWQRSTPMEHGLRLIEKIDLIVTKQLTDRAIDRTDGKGELSSMVFARKTRQAPRRPKTHDAQTLKVLKNQMSHK